MKLLEISSCKQCRYMKEYLPTISRCIWQDKLIESPYMIPDWCPLPETDNANPCKHNDIRYYNGLLCYECGKAIN